MTKAEEKKKIAMPTDEDVDRYAGKSPESGDEAAGQGAAVPAGDAMETLRTERDELKDKLLRAQAECANISKRMHQQNVEAVKLAGMGLARDVLHVVDSFERSLAGFQSVSADSSLTDGVKMIADQLAKVLSDHGIKPIEAVGKPFDPSRHEAMMSDYESDKPVGTVTAELQRGYTMHDRVLRPAKVMVAAQKAEESSDQDSEEAK